MPPDAVGGLRDYPDPAILHPGRPAFVALGDNKLRVELLQKADGCGICHTGVHQRCRLGQPQRCAGAGLHHHAARLCGAGVHLGVGCIVNAGAIVDHDAALGRGVHVAPGGIVKAGPWLPSTPRSIPVRSSAPRGRAVDGPPPRLH